MVILLYEVTYGVVINRWLYFYFLNNLLHDNPIPYLFIHIWFDYAKLVNILSSPDTFQYEILIMDHLKHLQIDKSLSHHHMANLCVEQQYYIICTWYHQF